MAEGAGAEPGSMPTGAGLGKGGTVQQAGASAVIEAVVTKGVVVATSATSTMWVVAEVASTAVMVTVTNPQAAILTRPDTICKVCEPLHGLLVHYI